MSLSVDVKQFDKFRKNTFSSILTSLTLLLILISSVPGMIHIIHQIRSDCRYFESKIAISRENYPLSLQKLDMAVALNPYNLPALYDKSFVLSKLGEYQKAFDNYVLIERIHPNYQRIHRNKAILLQRIFKQTHSQYLLQQAVIEMEKEKSINISEEIHFNLAQLYELSAEKEKSFEEYEIFIRQFLDLHDQIKNSRMLRSPSDTQLILPNNLTELSRNFSTTLLRMNEIYPDKTGVILESLRMQYARNSEIMTLLNAAKYE